MNTRDLLGSMRKARRDLHGPCRVLGCITTALPGDKACARHARGVFGNKYDERGIPKKWSERVYLAHKYCRSLKDAVASGEIDSKQLREHLEKVVFTLLKEELPKRRGGLREADIAKVTSKMDRSPFKELLSEHTKHFWMYRRKPMLDLLVKMPYELQVANVKEEGGFLKVLLMARVDHKFDGFTGYLSSLGGFLPKEALIPIFEEAFTSGRLVLVSAQRSTLHKLPGRRVAHPEYVAFVKDIRSKRRLMRAKNKASK